MCGQGTIVNRDYVYELVSFRNDQCAQPTRNFARIIAMTCARKRGTHALRLLAYSTCMQGSLPYAGELTVFHVFILKFKGFKNIC